MPFILVLQLLVLKKIIVFFFIFPIDIQLNSQVSGPIDPDIFVCKTLNLLKKYHIQAAQQKIATFLKVFLEKKMGFF